MVQNYFHSNVSGKDEISQTCSSFSIPTNSYAISYLRYNNRGEVYDGRLFWFLTYIVSACNFSRYIISKMFSKNEKALRNTHIWRQKGQKQGILDTTNNSDRSERRNDLLRLRHPVVFIA